MKYIFVLIISIIVVCSICDSSEYTRIPPKNPLIIRHEWSFSTEEVITLLLAELIRKEVILPKSENIGIGYRILSGGYALGMGGIDLIIKEETTIVEKK